MADEVTTRAVAHDEVTAEFVEEAAELLNRAFDGWPRLDLAVSSADHLVWKMNGALPGFPAALAAEIDGRLAGYRTVLARRVLVQGVPKLFLHFVDAGVDPELQGRGVNGAVQRLMVEEFHPQFDLSIDDGTLGTIVRSRDRLGGVDEFGNPVRPAVLPLDATRYLRARSRRRMVAPAALLLRVASMATRLVAQPRRGRRAACSIRTVEEFDARFDEFCAEAATPFDLIAERTAAFLNWRYADPRAGDFTIRVAEREGRLLGYMVTKTGAELTSVADLLVAPGEAAVAGALIEEAVRAGREAGSAAVSCWLPQRHPYRRALRAAGFVALGRRTSLVYRTVSMSAEELSFLGDRGTSMHLTEGDTDFI